MPNDDEFDVMAAACIAAHEAVQEHGSPELQTISRLLLHTLAREMATAVKRQTEDDGHADAP